jgi:type I restriction enzyme, S subunit
MSDCLPSSWSNALLGDIADLITGAGFPKEHQGNQCGELPFAKVGDISRAHRSGHQFISSADHYVSEEMRQKLKARLFPEGSIVFAKIGEALRNNYRAITTRPMLFDNNVMGVTPDLRIVETKYLYYFLSTQDFGRFAVATVVPSVRGSDIASTPLPVAPINEQHRIIAKIEELFSELDKGIETLTATREQLKAYRQSVLKYAFEGKLTAMWRKKQNSALLSSAALRDRLSTERQAYHERLLADWRRRQKKWEASEGDGTKPSRVRPLDHIGPISREVRDTLPTVPDGWVWEKLGWMTGSVEYGTASKSAKTGKVPVIRMGNLQNGYIDWDDLVFTSDKDEIEQYMLNPGDVLFNRTNSPELVGKTAIY